MTKQKLIKIEAFSYSTMSGIICLVIGFVIGLFNAIFSAIFVSIVPNAGAATFINIGILSVVFYPLIMGVMGFIFGLIIATVYNLVAQLVGGIELEFK